MTNTLNKLAWAGYVHIRPDWDDARRKFVAISPAGRQACEEALSAVAPVISEIVREIGEAATVNLSEGILQSLGCDCGLRCVQDDLHSRHSVADLILIR